MLITKKDAAFLFKHRATSTKLQATSGKRQAERAKVSTLLNAILPDRKG